MSNRAHFKRLQHIYYGGFNHLYHRSYAIHIYNHGSGLSPGPVHAPTHIFAILNILQYTYMLSNMCGHDGWATFLKALPCLEVTGSTPAKCKDFNPINRWHVVAIDWATCRHPIHCQQAMSHANCSNDCLPHVVRPATSASIRTVRSTSLFFAYLSFWTERDISRSRCPFEPKWVALVS